MGHGLCESFNKQAALANAQGQATSDSKDVGDHAWRLLKSWSFDPAELRGIGIHIQKLEGGRSGDVGQAKLPFQVADRKPTSKGLAPAPRQSEVDDIPELVVNVQPPSSQGELMATDDAPMERHNNQIALPSFSQLDMEVVEALPEDIQKELEDVYLRRSHSPMVVDRAPAPIPAAPAASTKTAAKATNVKRITQQLAPKSSSNLSPKMSVLFAKRDTPTSASAVRVSDAELRELEIDPGVFAALPVDMQREQLIMARHTKKGGAVVSERRLVIKDTTRAPRDKPTYPKKPAPTAHRPRPPALKQQGKRQGEKVSFSETEDVQRVMEAWVERFEGHPPNHKDVDFFGRFLVQSVEFSDVGMEKTIAVMRWWLVLLRRRWGAHEREESEDHRAAEGGTSEVVGKAWWKAFREVKEKVDVAARKRFGGTLVLT